ncbi:NAD-dependent epimerase/dehydratase family protein [Polaromonas sp. YR568]|uniref:NAD-dependent epimerase/dehydratase family protein n=1 Tax=Polaromonas sp. YR568 TaxID=1855301 RepID=UPI003137926E
MTRGDVLLLGGGGFIGTALAARLQQSGQSVRILGRLQTSQTSHLAEALRGCRTVVHLACTTTPGVSATRPELELGNIELTSQLTALLQHQPETHLIFFSSGGTVYGNCGPEPVNEDAPLAPLSAHGEAKLLQESACEVLRAQGHAVTILRPSNAYGPGQTLKGGFGLVRTLLECSRQDMPLEIWGDGENVRDFIYIGDVVEAAARLIGLPKDSGTYNLSSGNGYSVNQVRDMVQRVCGRRLATTYRPARSVDVRRVVLDNARSKARLGWQPAVALEAGIANTWSWLQGQPNPQR